MESPEKALSHSKAKDFKDPYIFYKNREKKNGSQYHKGKGAGNGNTPKCIRREIGFHHRCLPYSKAMVFQAGRDFSNVGSIGFGKRHTVQRELEGREKIHTDIPFNIGNIETGCRFLRFQLNELILGHGIKANHIVIRKYCHFQISCLSFKAQLILCFNEGNGNMAFIQLIRKVFYILLIAQHFLALEDNGAHPVGSIQLLQEKIHIGLRNMSFISRTENHVEAAGCRIFYGFRINAQFHLHKLVVNRIHFQRVHTIHFKGTDIILFIRRDRYSLVSLK